jgi:proteasome beta subunit
MSERPLPWFAAGHDPGPSFFELLRRAAPDALTTAGSGDGDASRASSPSIPHGTTVVALRYADGVVMGGDRRATEGLTIAGRRMEKVQPADRWSGVAIAGAAGPAMELVRLFQTELEHYEKVEGEPLSLDGKANRLSQMVRGNLPAAMQGFVVVPLFAGFDRQRQRGRLFKYDVTGGRYEELDFHATGSGSVHARNWMKASWREDMSADEAIELVLRSLLHAADEDAGTGGADLIRGIYPTVSTISDEGYADVPEEAIAEAVRGILDALAEGGNG